MNQPNLDRIALTLIKAVVASMTVVKSAQKEIHTGALKSDGTSASQAYLASEAAGIKILKLTGLDIWAEEGGLGTIHETDEVILFDPLDGTRPFLTGAISSTVIAATYDLKKKRVTRCVVGEPVSGRIWFATQGGGTWVFYTSDKISLENTIAEAKQCKVWDGSLHNKSTMFLDLYPGFQKEGYPAISDALWGRFFQELFGRTTAISMFGSNGLHHALVANGAEGVAGAITTAMGGPWDVAPVLLTLEAGGSAQAFKINTQGFLEKKHALDVLDYNLVISANNTETLEELEMELINTLEP